MINFLFANSELYTLYINFFIAVALLLIYQRLGHTKRKNEEESQNRGKAIHLQTETAQPYIPLNGSETHLESIIYSKMIYDTT